MSRFAECCGKYERGQRCGACPLDDALVDSLGGNPELREEILARLSGFRAALAAATAREEASVLAMREQSANVAQDMIGESWANRHYAESHSVANERTSMTRAVSAMAERIRALPAPTSALAAHTERVLARALAAAKGGVE